MDQSQHDLESDPMNDPGNDVPLQHRWFGSIDPWVRILPLFPAVSVLVTVGTLLYVLGVLDGDLSFGSALGQSIGSILFGSLVHIGLIALIYFGKRIWSRALAAIIITSAVYVVVICLILISTIASESSTAGLNILFLPVFSAFLLVPSTLIVALVHRLRSRPGQRGPGSA